MSEGPESRKVWDHGQIPREFQEGALVPCLPQSLSMASAPHTDTTWLEKHFGALSHESGLTLSLRQVTREAGSSPSMDSSRLDQVL